MQTSVFIGATDGVILCSDVLPFCFIVSTRSSWLWCFTMFPCVMLYITDHLLMLGMLFCQMKHWLFNQLSSIFKLKMRTYLSHLQCIICSCLEEPEISCHNDFIIFIYIHEISKHLNCISLHLYLSVVHLCDVMPFHSQNMPLNCKRIKMLKLL